MNKEWSDTNKRIQKLLTKATYENGIKELIELRDILMNEMLTWKEELKEEDFSKQPFMNADGYHSKTIAYSIWHIVRIEDIVVNTLVQKKEEILFQDRFMEKIGASIITTGNELVKQEIADFSKKLHIDVLYDYAKSVKASTDSWLRYIAYPSLKTKFDESDKARIRNLNVVSTDEKAIWLLEYWCNKDIKGLIQMPLSRHWIMHVEAANRIKKKITGR